MKKGLGRKWISILLAAAVALSLLAGCKGKGGTDPGKPEDTGNTGTTGTPAAEKEQGPDYYGQDISQHVELVMYVIGDKAPAEDLVLEQLNLRLKEKINAMLRVKHLSLSDYTQKYSLLLSSGEKFDLIYTSTWAMYSAEAAKGAFAEVTQEVLEKYMPQTGAGQAQEAFDQAKIGGKTYFVPANNARVVQNLALIRGDLREKYGLSPLKSVEDLQIYYEKVAEEEEGLFPYAASQKNDELKYILINADQEYRPVNGVNQFFCYQLKDGEMTAGDVVWLYETEVYKNWMLKMKSWADRGFWSKNAVANNTSPKEAFLSGTSASLLWNLDTCGSVANQVMAEHPEWKPEIYDLTPDNRKTLGAYTGDGMAVTAASSNQERAFMLIDLLKFDQECNDLVFLGIEGEHWTNPAADTGKEGYFRLGEKQADYPYGGCLSWAFKNRDLSRVREDTFADVLTITETWNAKQTNLPLGGFNLDDSGIKNEITNLNNLFIKYIPLLDLGLVEEPEATLEEFNRQAELAGLEKIKEEVKKQVGEYLANK